MALFGFGKRPKPQQFKYIPRYYDEDKEERADRLGLNAKDDVERAKQRLKSGLRRGGGYRYMNVDTAQAKKQRNIRLILILAILALFVYYVLVSDVFLNFISAIETIEKMD